MEGAEDKRVRVIDPEVLEEFKRAARPRSAWKVFLDRSLYYVFGILLLLVPLGAAAGYFIWDGSPNELSSDELVRLMEEREDGGAARPDSDSGGNTELEESILFVDSSPVGAEVLIDGSSIGNTPINGHRVEPGVYVISIQQEPYATLDTVVFVSEDDPALVLDINLARAVPLPRDVAYEPPRASPAAADESARNTTVEADRRPPTSARQPAAQEVGDVAGNREETPPAAMESTPSPASGTLTVLVRPWGSIYVDGVLMKENTDVKFDTSLPAGRHVVRAYHPALGEREIAVDITADRPQNVVVDLLTQDDEQNE